MAETKLGGAVPPGRRHLVQQLSVIGGVIAVVPGIAGAVHTGGTVQGVDTQAGVIRHGGQTAGLAERFGLDAGILGKGSAGLLGVEVYT